MFKIKSVFIVLLLFSACTQTTSEKEKNGSYTESATTLFSKISQDYSSVRFNNVVEQQEDFNFLNYSNVYSGAGVAAGDFDNDGLEDLYFVSNFGPNKLYKNEGNFTFKDITLSSKTEDFQGFSTGVSLFDVNNDGWLDIYVCKAGSLKDSKARENLLFVNQKDGTFTEEAAKWGLNDPAYSTQSYPIDYDNDGDMDLYLVNHRYDFKNVAVLSGDLQNQIEDTTTDHLYRNDGSFFTKVTAQTGLYNKTWGLSAVISDFNEDGWDDIFVANDFLEPDILYINQQDGTFKDEIRKRLSHISFYSMGSDYADINNDLLPDLISVDMTSSDHARSKENMASMDSDAFQLMVDVGYHHAYMANTFQLNTGHGKFAEIAQLSGVSKTDWSWAPLLADFDNDGLKDLFITNGVDREYNNNDTRAQLRKLQADQTPISLTEVLAMFPSEKITNEIYRNAGDLSFERKAMEWGLPEKTFSHGAVYVDLDNDGDLDLVTNNVDDPAGIYKNNANQNFIQIQLSGPEKNKIALGSKVYVETEGATQTQELRISRGYESSVSKVLSFGLGNESTITQVLVEWPDGKVSKIEQPKANERHTISYASATDINIPYEKPPFLKKTIAPTSLDISYIHKENLVDDYEIQLLIPQKQSTKGTGIVKADLNGDDLEDFFVGNAAGAPASMYLQNTNGSFSEVNKKLWRNEAAYEDAGALFFDADQDGDQDLYVVSAGYELQKDNALLQDRLYINDGKGTFRKEKDKLPSMLTSGKNVVAGDYDQDGDLDIFVGGNVVSGEYPKTPRSYLLQNNKGLFTDVTLEHSGLESIGMISQSLFTDYDADGDLDLLVTGEWMAPTFFQNNEGVFEAAQNISGFDKTEGWWLSATAGDFDGDGDEDYVLGNFGTNNKFHPSEKKPLYIYGKDFDGNGSFDVALSKENKGKLVPIRGKQCSSEQNPYLLEKIETYKEFASLEMKDIYGEDRLKGALQRSAYTFETVYVENKGQGIFELKKLPNVVQMGPTTALLNRDLNNDGHLDIMGVGAIYDAEVETIRYDSNYGYVLLGDGTGKFTHNKAYDPFIETDAKAMTEITIQEKPHYLVVSNNAPLEIFTFAP